MQLTDVRGRPTQAPKQLLHVLLAAMLSVENLLTPFLPNARPKP